MKEYLHRSFGSDSVCNTLVARRSRRPETTDDAKSPRVECADSNRRTGSATRQRRVAAAVGIESSGPVGLFAIVRRPRRLGVSAWRADGRGDGGGRLVCRCAPPWAVPSRAKNTTERQRSRSSAAAARTRTVRGRDDKRRRRRDARRDKCTGRRRRR